MKVDLRVEAMRTARVDLFGELFLDVRIKFTTSRPRHSNDNARAESKNGAVVRKHLGYAHIPQQSAEQVNACCTHHLNPYVNFHRGGTTEH